ncbi:MAG: imidazole glycerol phosphate synthase cyclase subunit [Gammaproteobacteria bacterium]|nr:imidazole glycerol phosphate synthase cyclase subunit [Gammaproteobacteria bacterium]MDH5801226.1 imidazole glycerol phosphate synthase cyclase subunit [Gammaproteobacteria bacterium]
MLKIRIIPILLVRGSSIVKTVQFDDARMVGDSITNVKVFSSRMADEMVIVDIDAYKSGRINEDLIKRLAAQCVMPLSVGGGVRSVEDADRLFRSGADKVVINSAFYSDPSLIEKVSKKYGRQAVVFSLDVKKENSVYYAASQSANIVHDVGAVETAQKVVSMGVGEILLNSVDNDGKMNGYDLGLIKSVSQSVDVPIVAAGGCGSKEDCVKAINSGATAIAAGSIFYWIGESIITIKKHMSEQGLPMRLI